MLSKAFSKSTKHIYKLEFHSIDFSMMFLRVNSRFVVPLPDLNPACSSRRQLSTSLAIRLTNIFPRILLAVGMRVIPLAVRSPFFGSFTMRPFFQSVGTVSSVQTFCISWCICFEAETQTQQRQNHCIVN